MANVNDFLPQDEVNGNAEKKAAAQQAQESYTSTLYRIAKTHQKREKQSYRLAQAIRHFEDLEGKYKDFTDQEKMILNDKFYESYFGDSGKMQYGNLINGGVAFERADDYSRKLVDYIAGGFQAIASDKYFQAIELESSGKSSREKLLAVGRNDYRDEADFSLGGYSVSPYGESVKSFKRVAKTTPELDQEWEDYFSETMQENVLAIYKRAKVDIDPSMQTIIEASMANGGEITEEQRAEYTWWRYDKIHNEGALGAREVQTVDWLMTAAKGKRYGWWGKTGAGLWDMVKGFGLNPWTNEDEGYKGFQALVYDVTYDVAQDADARARAAANPQNAQGERAIWNDEEKAIYHQLAKEWRDPNSNLSSREFATMMADVSAAKRFRLEQMDFDKQNQYHKNLLEVHEILKPAAQSQGFLLDGLSEAIVMAPYMAASAIPYAGTSLVAMQGYGEIRDRILLAGGTMDDAICSTLLTAAAYAGIERLQFEGLIRPMTDLQMKSFVAGIYRNAKTGQWTRAKAWAGQAARAGFTFTKESIPNFIFEDLQEGFQEGLMAGYVEGVTGGDLGSILATAEDAFKQACVDAAPALLWMSGGSTVGKMVRATNKVLDAESLMAYTLNRAQVLNALDGLDVAPGTVDALSAGDESDARQNKAMQVYREAQTIYEGASDKFDALRQIQEKFGIDKETMEGLAAVLDMEDYMVNYLVPNIEDEARRARAEVQVAGLRRGDFLLGKKGITRTYAPVELLKAINPSLEIEDVSQYAPKANEVHKTDHAYKITLPLKDAAGNEVKKTFTLLDGTFKPDIHTEGYAVSVENAMKGTPDAITAKAYLALSNAERAAFLKEHQLGSAGDFNKVGFTLYDENGKEIISTDGLVQIQRGDALGTRKGTNWTLTHETGHAIVQFAREIGAIRPGDETVQLMRRAFGEAVSEGELWNEEAMSDGFGDYLAGKYDFSFLAEQDRGLLAEAFEAIARMLKALARMVGFNVPQTPQETMRQGEAYTAIYEAIRKGDFRGLSKYAGIEFDREKTTREKTEIASSPAAPRNDVQDAGFTPVIASEAKQSTTAEPDATEADWVEAVAETEAKIAENPVQVAANVPLRTGAKMTVNDPNYQMEAEVELAWVPLAEMVESTGDREIQMRDRSRYATDKQVHEKTRKGVFNALALFPARQSDAGSPILAGGNQIISGHGRKLMLETLAREGRFASDYLAVINAEARKSGFAPSPEGMENPVLVQRIVAFTKNHGEHLKLSESEMHDYLARFAKLSNTSGIQQFSEAEQAEMDARVILAHAGRLLPLYAPDRSGNLLAASNRGFMMAFANLTGATNLTDSNGRPTASAAVRAQQALMTAVFGNDEKIRGVLRSLMERASELSLGSLQQALVANAGSLLAMKARGRASFDIVSDVAESAYHYIAWRIAQQTSPKLTLRDHLLQGDLLAPDTPPMQQALAQLLQDGRFGTVLARYNQLVAEQERDAQGTLGGIAEKRTPLQLLGFADRQTMEKGSDGLPVTPYATPDPDSAEAKADLPRMEPPAVSEEPIAEPEPDIVIASEAKQSTSTPGEHPPTGGDALAVKQSTEAIRSAESILQDTPEEPAVFIPTAHTPGTLTRADASAGGEMRAYQVNSDGAPATVPKTLPAGVWNRFRRPYGVNQPKSPVLSQQDKDGRGLGIYRPTEGGRWSEIFPHFQGNKTKMALRTTQAIRKNMSPAERGHYTMLVDLFGGGGCWGLYHALTNFPNVNQLFINEFEGGRLGKIRLLQEMGARVADEAWSRVLEPILPYLERHVTGDTESGTSGSPTQIKNYIAAIRDLFTDNIAKKNDFVTRATTENRRYLKDVTREELEALRDAIQGGDETTALFFAVWDCANTLLASVKDESGNVTVRAGLQKVVEVLRADGKKAKEAADAFKARGGTIVYHQGDAKTYINEVPSGDAVMTVADPPYYHTRGYDLDNNASMVPLEAQPLGYGYGDTVNLMQNLVAKGDGIIYTDEAWWYKPDYSVDTQVDIFSQTSRFDIEQAYLLDLTNSLDHFDVAGEVDGRQEVLGVHHGHSTQAQETNYGDDGRAEGSASADADAVLVGSPNRVVRGGFDQGGQGDNRRHAVQRVAGGAEEQNVPLQQDRARGGRKGGTGSRALARELVVGEARAAIEAALGAPLSEAQEDVLRNTFAHVLDEYKVDYERFISEVVKNNKQGVVAENGILPIPPEYDVRFSVVYHGSGADFDRLDHARFSVTREEAQNWNATIDALAAGTIDSRQNYSVLTRTPAVLQMLDVRNLPIEVTGGVLNKVTKGKHNIVVDDLRRLPYELDRPIAVFQSATHGDSYTILTTLKEGKDNVIVALALDFERRDRVVVNEILSAYGKSSRALNEWAKSGLLRFIDETKNRSLPRDVRLQLPKTRLAKNGRSAFKNEDDLQSFIESTTSIPQLAANSNPRHTVSRLYTGSGASYEKPSLNYIGTGEGAQAYGWGLYASEREGVARGYAEAGGGFSLDESVGLVYGFSSRFNNPIKVDTKLKDFFDWAKRELKEINNTSDYSHALKKFLTLEANFGNLQVGDLVEQEEYGSDVFFAHFVKKFADALKINNRHLYEQTFFTDKEQPDLLDWYQPLTEGQIEKIEAQLIKEKLHHEIMLDDIAELSSGEFYESLSSAFAYLNDNDGTPQPRLASEFLARAGIDGVRYPIDAYTKPQNRDYRKGANYVSFRDDNIRVDKHTRYSVMRENVLSGDDVRATMPGYDPGDWQTHVDRTGYVGERMKNRFEDLLANRRGKGEGKNKGVVVFLAGGNGAGKSTVSNAIVEPPDFVIDSTLGNLAVAREQIRRILDNGQRPHIYFVYRTPDQALSNIQTRIDKGGHTVSPRSFADSHTKSLQNLPLLVEEFNDKIKVDIFDFSSGGQKIITLNELKEKGLPDYEEIRAKANLLRPLARSGEAAERNSVRIREESLRGSGSDARGASAEGIAGSVDSSRYSVVFDQAKIARLENEETISTYRAMVKLGDKYYPPMATKIVEPGEKKAKLQEGVALGHWVEADERPDLVVQGGNGEYYFPLRKSDGKTIQARYNPYIHTSYTPLNDQFASAQDREDIVIVEMAVPKSELTSGYKAEKAKDAVGAMEWKAGKLTGKLTGTRKVVLSRWAKLVREVPYGEVADKVQELFGGDLAEMPFPSNVVHPELRRELEARGRKFYETDNRGNVRFSVSAEEQQAMRNTIAGWFDKDDISWAKGKTLKEISEKLGNELKPIYYIPEKYTSYFKGVLTDNRVYCGRAYFVEHAANHKHEDVEKDDFINIQDIISNPDEIIVDRRKKPNGDEKDGLMFVKKIDGSRIVSVELMEEPNGKLVFHKSMYNSGRNRVYPSLPRLSVDGRPQSVISQDAIPGGSLSARDTIIIPQSLPNSNHKPVEFKPVEKKSETPAEGERHAVVRGGLSARDVATGFVAQRILAGKKPNVEDVQSLLNNMGLTHVSAGDVLAKATSLAEKNRTFAADNVVKKTPPDLLSVLSRAMMVDRYKEGLESAVVGGARVNDPQVGRRVQEVIQRRADMNLRAAKGWTAEEMMAELPISLTDAIFAVADYRKQKPLENKPESAADLPAVEDDVFGVDPDEAALQAHADMLKKAHAALDALMGRAKANLATQEELEAIAKKKREDNAATNPDDTAVGGDDGEGDAYPEDLIPIAQVERIAPLFDDPKLFASFLIEWTADKILANHPEIENTGRMWKNPVAVRELVRTAQQILGKLNRDTLGLSVQRNMIDVQINDLSNYERFEAIRRHIAFIYERIHDDALNASRRRKIKALVNYLKGVKSQKIFNANTEEMQRKNFAKVEQWCNWVRRYITMGEDSLTKEKAFLRAVVDGWDKDPDYVGYTKENDLKYIEACDKLAIIEKYGNLRPRMPIEIDEAANEIRAQVEGKRAEFEARREARVAKIDALRQAFVDAVVAGGAARKREDPNSWWVQTKRGFGRLGDALQGDVNLRAESLIRYCPDENLRAKAQEYLDAVKDLLAESEATYVARMADATIELHAGMEACYGSFEAGRRHLSEVIPQDLDGKIFKDRKDKHTYGQLLQLYSSLIQEDYKENVVKHGRAGQAAIIRQHLEKVFPQDLAFHHWAVGWNSRNRQALSDAVEAVTGLPVSSVDKNYIKVYIANEKSGFSADVMAYSAIPSGLSRRIRHGLDFNENVNFLEQLTEAAELRAQTIAFAESGTYLRDLITHRDVRKAVKENVSAQEMSAFEKQVRDVLTQGVEHARNNAAFGWFNKMRAFVGRAYISGNLVSASKQALSIPVWAHLDGVSLIDVGRWLLTCRTAEGRQAIEELCQHDGYKARYVMGWDENTRNILAEPPSKHALIRWYNKAMNAGMAPMRFMDKICSLAIAQGYYRAQVAKMIEQGKGEAEAKKAALARTWQAVEATQQSGRVSLQNRIQREHEDFGKALFQFTTAQLLQSNYVIAATKEVAAGRKGSVKKLAHALMINHLLVPALTTLVSQLWQLLMGEEPPWDDEDEGKEVLRELMVACALGSWNNLFLVSNMIESSVRKLMGGKSQFGSEVLPMAGVERIVGKWGEFAWKGGGATLQFLGADLEDEIESEDLMESFVDAVGASWSPVRQGRKAIKNWSERD